MKTVEKVTGMVRRGSTYSVRRRVPLDLVAALGKREVTISLGTSNHKVAAREARRRLVEQDERWAAMRQALARGEPVRARGAVTETDIRSAVLRDFWQGEQGAVDKPDEDVGDSLRDDIAGLEGRDPSLDAALVVQARALIKERKLDIALPAERKIGQPVEPFAPSPELLRLVELLRRSDIERLRRALDRMDGQHGDLAHDPLFAGINSVSPRPAASEGITLGEAIERMMSDPTRTHLGDTADAKYLQTFRAMKELLGEDKPLASITRADCSAVKMLVAGLPANVKKLKAYDGCKTLREIVALAAQRGDKRISVGTVVVYVHALSAFFNWSISAGLLTVNPATRLAPRRSSKVSRRPFTVEEMNKIVAGLGEWSKDGALPGRWWVPLIAAFTGMRLGEIVTFTVDDIGVRDGVECFALRKTADKSLKNDHSERVFPVHPELVRLGLLQHVAAERARGGKRLFPDLRGDSQKHVTKLFQKRFGYLQKTVLKIDEAGTCFHSFRHNFRDALREGGLPIDAIRALGGWARSGGVEERYGQGTRPATLARWLGEVKYDGLVLPAPYGASGKAVEPEARRA